MSMEHVFNFLCYDLRFPLCYCLEVGQKSIANLNVLFRSLLWFFKSKKNCYEDEDVDVDVEEDECLCQSRYDSNIDVSKCASGKVDLSKGKSPLSTQLEIKSKEAWQSQNKNTCPAEWWDLTEFQKLMFYWMAVADEILSENPFENFKNFYEKNCKCNMKSCSQQLWFNMNKDQRMPFKFESCIARIASGKIDFRNEKQIRDYMSKPSEAKN